jgi:hypothetical protein
MYFSNIYGINVYQYTIGLEKVISEDQEQDPDPFPDVWFWIRIHVIAEE